MGQILAEICGVVQLQAVRIDESHEADVGVDTLVALLCHQVAILEVQIAQWARDRCHSMLAGRPWQSPFEDGLAYPLSERLDG